MAKEKETIFVAKTNFRGSDRIFGIKTKDRRQHVYVVGKTGTGKTTLIKNMVLQDVRAGRGVGVIDPHGEFVEEVLSQIPPERTNDVVYFNPVDSEYPIGFNVLEVPDFKYKHLVVSDLLGIFTKIWANVWSARMEYILQNCIMALLDTPGTTLLGIPRLLVDKDYRQKIVANVKDPVVKSFWVHEYETWRDQFRNEAIVPIQNKVNQFLNTSFIRNIVGQTKSTLNIPEIMNEGKILLVNVSKGRVGEDNSALLGAMIITKIQLAAMERVRIPEEDRKDFYLYVDEFQNFATDSFANILSEARKYLFNLIIAHQYVGQLVTDVSTKVRDAVFGNVGTMIAFRVGATDAEFLEKEFEPEFGIQDLINLPNHHVYLKLMVNGVTSRPFSAVTIPPLKFETDPMVKEKILRVSRERYTNPRAEVEEKIARWSGLSGDIGGGGDEEASGMFESTCWNCGKIATTPFKPDGKRPVYCLNCLRQIEEGKLIPLPERMPRVGREKFAATLGDLGIEFSGEGRPREPVGAGVPHPSPERRISGERRGEQRASSGGGRPFPPRAEPRQERKEFERPRSRGGERPPFGATFPREARFASPGGGQQFPSGKLPSRPVVKTFQVAKPMSLSTLRPKESNTSGTNVENKEPVARSGAGEPRPAGREVDVLGLRKALDAALSERASPVESGRAATMSEPRPDGREALNSEDKKKEVNTGRSKEEKKIEPGETVRF